MSCIHLSSKLAEYVIEEAMKEQQKLNEATELDARANLIFDPDTQFSDRFESVVQDMLIGRNASQHTPGIQKPPSNTDEDSTSDY